MLNESVNQAVSYGAGQAMKRPTYSEALDDLQKANERVKAALVHMLNATDAEVRAHRAQVLANAISELARAAYVFQGAAFEAAHTEKLTPPPSVAE